MDENTRKEFWVRSRATELSNTLKLSKSAIYRWRESNQIPVKRLRAVSEVTGFSREQLRPDIFA